MHEILSNFKRQTTLCHHILVSLFLTWRKFDFNPFQISVSFLCPLKFLENLWLCNIFRGYREGEFVEMGLACFVWKIYKSPHKLILFEVNKKITRLLFHDGGPYHIETSPLIFSANQKTVFYKIEIFVKKEVMSRMFLGKIPE